MTEEQKSLATTRKSQLMDLTPTTFAEAARMAETLAGSDLVPKDYKGKPGNVLVAMQMGSEVGLQPMQAIQNIAVINGRPCVWGDAMIGLVRSSKLCEYIHEWWDANRDVAVCEGKRRGDDEPYRVEFGMKDAEAAKLKGKPGPWTDYPRRMCQMRARSWVCRDLFADVLRGLQVAEDAMDLIDITPAADRRRERPTTSLSELAGGGAKPEPEAPAEAATAQPTLKFVLEAIKAAQTLEDLQEAGNAAALLSDADKGKAREAWRKRSEELKPLADPDETPEPEGGTVPDQADDTARIRTLKSMIAEAESVGQLESLAEEVSLLNDEALRKAYKARKVELEMDQMNGGSN